MRWLVALALLAGCPAPVAPVTEPGPPPPPPPAPIDAAPAPAIPSVLAARAAGGGGLELVHVTAGGEVRVLHALARARGAPGVADLAVDGATGRYGLLVEADTVDGVPTATPRDVMSLVLGTVAGDTVAIGPGDRTCVMHRCFESAIAIAPGGDAVVTTLRRSSASDLARYAFGPAPRPTRLTSAGAERPVLSPDHARLAYVRAHAIHVVDVGVTTAGAPIATGVRDVAALALGADVVAHRTRDGRLEVRDVATGGVLASATLAADGHPVLRAAGGNVVTTDGARVVVVPVAGGATRTLAGGALIDVSADGAWALVDDGALAIVAVASGEIVARLDVPAAFGQVRARLAP